MSDIKKYIESGILESYVLGLTTDEESIEVRELSEKNEEIRDEIEKITIALQNYASSKAPAFNPMIKVLLFATIDYKERLKKGEAVSVPPILNENSKIEDYQPWLDRIDMVLPHDFKEVHAKIIGFTREATTAIVWLKSMAPQEVHDNEYEKFLVLEGSCDITIDDKVHQLIPGDYLSIPLHSKHHVTITSKIPCKIILQRVAA